MKGTVKLFPEAIRKVRDRLAAKRKNVQDYRISVGIHEEEGQKPALKYDGSASRVSLLYVALVHEFGAGNVPEESFLRAWYDQNLPRLQKESVAAMRAEYAGNKGVVEQTARAWTDELMEWLKSGNAGLAELSPSTIKARERVGLPPTPPLVATEQLVEAIRVIISRP